MSLFITFTFTSSLSVMIHSYSFLNINKHFISICYRTECKLLLKTIMHCMLYNALFFTITNSDFFVNIIILLLQNKTNKEYALAHSVIDILEMALIKFSKIDNGNGGNFHTFARTDVRPGDASVIER